MAKKNAFLLVSLNEDKAKKLAEIISNKTCRRILEYLSEKDASATEISNKLNLPLSTVHYNIQHLLEGNLIETEEFHYSDKGKEVNHYRLANKYIIIAPKTVEGIKDKLKAILPVALLTAGVAYFIQMFSKKITTVKMGAVNSITEPIGAINSITEPMAEKMLESKALDMATNDLVANGMIGTTSQSVWQNIALWFIIGAIFALVIYFIVEKIRKINK